MAISLTRVAFANNRKNNVYTNKFPLYRAAGNTWVAAFRLCPTSWCSVMYCLVVDGDCILGVLVDWLIKGMNCSSFHDPFPPSLPPQSPALHRRLFVNSHSVMATGAKGKSNQVYLGGTQLKIAAK